MKAVFNLLGEASDVITCVLESNGVVYCEYQRAIRAGAQTNLSDGEDLVEGEYVLMFPSPPAKFVLYIVYVV